MADESRKLGGGKDGTQPIRPAGAPATPPIRPAGAPATPPMPPGARLPPRGKLPGAIEPPRKASALAPGKPLPPLPESSGGVVTGASTSSRPPPAKRSALPTLAPPKRKADADAPPADLSPAEGTVEADDIDISIETLLKEHTEPGKAPGSTPPPNLPAICMYGRFEILGRIAFGGMAEIFLGRETTSVGAARYLVIKRILPHVADDDQFVEMFLDEARLAIQLNHPSICHIYEFGELEESYFIAMEWVNGVPLGKLIRKARAIGGVRPELVARVIAQIAEALHYAHRAKDALGRPMEIVHRDVSPHNIMVGYDGQVKLLDFGIAKAATHSSKTEAGVVKGKFSYMAPEQCLGKPLDGRVDVFALGICLYECLTGHALYHKENEYETMRAVINDPPPSIRDVDPDLPAELDAIVKRALAKDVADRYASAAQMQEALEHWLVESRKFVNAASVAVVMEELYEHQIKRGPLVDSTPFGQSFSRPKKDRSGPNAAGSLSDPLAAALSDPSVGALSQPTATGAQVVPPARRSPATLLAIAAVILSVGLGAGYALFYRPQAPPRVAAAEPTDSPLVEPPIEPPVAPVEPPTVVADPPPQPEGPRVGSVRIDSTPSGANVSIGGSTFDGTTPLTLPVLQPGIHHVVVTRSGYRSWEGDVEIEAGREASVVATLVPVTRAPVAPPGHLSINTRPWSKVYVGSHLLGTTPIAEVQVTSGNVRLRLVDRDGNTHTKNVRVAPGATERVFYELGQ